MKKTIHQQTYKQLTQWFKAARIEKGLTIRQLAEQINVHHCHVCGDGDISQRNLK